MDVLFRELDTHYQNIKLTSEVNPQRFCKRDRLEIMDYININFY